VCRQRITGYNEETKGNWRSDEKNPTSYWEIRLNVTWNHGVARWPFGVLHCRLRTELLGCWLIMVMKIFPCHPPISSVTAWHSCSDFISCQNTKYTVTYVFNKDTEKRYESQLHLLQIGEPRFPTRTSEALISDGRGALLHEQDF